ncbi:MFS transporter (plasmid) [Pantoea dispersa]|uniref:MFS transporter n=1 Tax=Pantoea dispersa TaxID=59814 RepID=UPI001CA6F824|nr:MFS transporter [Pantoea dispersa]QZY92599.1 MFS transporter [Pantoea dispersa]
MRKSFNPPETSKVLLFAGVLVVATNLRAPFTGLPPVLDLVTRDFHLTTTMTGLILTLPLLVFALLSPISAWLGKKLGLSRALFAGVSLVAGGILLRAFDTPGALFTGTAVIGAGIAIANVLLPSLIKRSFPERIGLITGCYVLSMGIAATIASTAIVPLSASIGWSNALLALIVLPLLAIALWIPQLRRSPAAEVVITPRGSSSVIWHSALAWQVTLFLGLNSVISYIAISWLPAILTDAGMTPAKAGTMHGILQLAIALPGLIIGPTLRHMKDQRIAAVISAGSMALGFLGLMVFPCQAAIWSVLLGLGSGASFILGLTFIGLRTEHAGQAAVLSGMAQCIGYLLAAAGPVVIGKLHEIFHNWYMPLILCVTLALFDAVFGLLAGRQRIISR